MFSVFLRDLRNVCAFFGDEFVLQPPDDAVDPVDRRDAAADVWLLKPFSPPCYILSMASRLQRRIRGRVVMGRTHSPRSICGGQLRLKLR